MREIKFKGRRIDTKEWVYGFYYEHEPPLQCLVPDNFVSPKSKHYILQTSFADWNMPRQVDFIEVDPDTVCQFTDLLDCGGQEIYKGDILSVTDPNGEPERLCIVEYDSLVGGYPYEPDGGYGDFELSTIGWAMMMDFEFEIIGNIYENPELLAEGKE